MERQTKRTKKLEPRRDTAGVDGTKKTSLTKKLEPRRDAARTASYDKRDGDDLEQDAGDNDGGDDDLKQDAGGDDDIKQDDGDDDDFEPDDGDDDDFEQDGGDDGKRRNKSVVTNKQRRQRCKMPSSPRTRERHQRAQRLFKLPKGYHCVSESNFLQLLTGTKTRLGGPWLKGVSRKACSDGIRDAYYDIYVREQIDWASFSLLNFYMDDVEAFTYMDSSPDGLHQRLIDLLCMIVFLQILRIRALRHHQIVLSSKRTAAITRNLNQSESTSPMQSP
jgi:hypothetical protein